MLAVLRLALLLVLLVVGEAEAQLWSGVLAPGRAVDWGAGFAGAGTIPARTTICSTVTAYSGTTTTIQNALNACPTGQTVKLGTGTFTLTGDISIPSDRTLRGSGPLQTILVFTSGGSSCSGNGTEHICIGNGNNWTGSPQHLTSWTAGYSKGTTVVTLSNVTGLTNGQLLILDQKNDTTDTNELFVCDTVGTCASDTTSPGRVVSGTSYNQQEYKIVTAVNGNNVTITPPLYMPNWSSGKDPSAWWATTVTHDAGIEDLTIDHATSDNTSGIMFQNAYKSWVKNIRSIYKISQGTTGRNHIWALYSARITVRDSYFYGSRNGQGNFSQSYGVEPWMTSDALYENNIFHRVTSPILVGCCSGTVFSYNYCFDNFNSSATQFPCISSHDAAGDMILLEGNQSPSHILQDSIHGTHNFQTVFRNQMEGRESVGKTSETMPANYQSHSRFVNVVGNVLGRGAYHNNYTVAEPTTTNCATSIYAFGFSNSSCGTSSVPLDGLVATTIMRWGNYDIVNNAVQFVAGENGSGAVVYPGLSSPTQTLPASFYLSAQPSTWWGTPWGTPPWPPVGPDVSGGNVTAGTGAASTLGGHAYKNPARLCYENTATDSNYNALSPIPLAFDATACYMQAAVASTTLAMFLATILILIFLARLGAIHARR